MLLKVVAGLISEIVLCIKEVNQKTRVAAYELLVELAQTMHERFPPPGVLGSTEDTGKPVSSRSFFCWHQMRSTALLASAHAVLQAKSRKLFACHLFVQQILQTSCGLLHAESCLLFWASCSRRCQLLTHCHTCLGLPCRRR